MFPVPIDLDKEEKTFGGLLTIRQVVYMVLAVFLAVLFFIFFKTIGISLIWGAFLCTPILMLGMAFAFFQMEGLRLDIYLFYLVRYHLRARIFYLKGDD